MRTAASRQVRFPHRDGHGGQNLVLEDKSLDALEDPEEDEQDADVLDPGRLDGLPEAGAVGGRGAGLRQKDEAHGTSGTAPRLKLIFADRGSGASPQRH